MVKGALVAFGIIVVLAWLGVGVFTMYTGSRGTLGAMFSLLRKGG